MATQAEILARGKAAYENASTWSRLMDEVSTYCTPMRKPINQMAGEQRGNGMDKVFDSTPTKAAFRFAGRLSRDVTPPFQKHADIAVGPALKAWMLQTVGEDALQNALDETNLELQAVTEQGQALLERANFALAADEMYLDLFGGQGAMLMLEDEVEIIRYVSVPAGEIALLEDGYSRVIGIYWRKDFKGSQMKPMKWYDKLPKEKRDHIDKNPNCTIGVLQASEWDADTRRWNYTALLADDENNPPLAETLNQLTCDWLTPRFWKLPGEAMGRGPGMAALPTIKTLNKVTELTLKAAAFAVLGLWTYRNDRVFNPKTARMYPGAMWVVSSNGGPMGPALQRQEMPGRFDVSNIVNQDLREQVKQITFDDALPPDSGAVRSATEIVERMKRLMSDLAGAYPRLLLEIIVPLWQRLIDVMYRRKIIKMTLPIDQLILRLQITSPIARAQAAQDVSTIVEWLQILISLMGQEGAMLAAKIEDVGTYIGQKLGVPPSLVRTDGEKKVLQQMIAKLIAQAMAQQGAAATPGAEPGQMPLPTAA